MAITWTRETVQSEASAVSGYTAQEAYNYFGYLVNDVPHNRYSNTEPYTDWFTDELNSALQIICAYAPQRIEIISTSTVASSGLYMLPDYAISTSKIRKIWYDGDILLRDSLVAIVGGEVDTLDEDSLTSDGAPVRWCRQGDRVIRLVPRPSVAKTMKVMLSTTHPNFTTASIADPIKIASYLKQAPSYYIASIAALRDGRPDLAKGYREAFWGLVNRKVEEDIDPVEPLSIPFPGKAYFAPGFDEDNF